MASSDDDPKRSEKLQYSEDHFQGYWVRLQTAVRKQEDADELLDGTLENPLETISEAVYNGDEEDEEDERLQRIALCIQTLYADSQLGDPPGSFPARVEVIVKDPLKQIKEFAIATKKGTKGGVGANGRNNAESRAWVKKAYEALLKYKKGCKNIWETSVATLPSSIATTVIGGVPFGNGLALLTQIKGQKQRQTTMALFTLFSQLITIHMKPDKGLTDLFGRCMEIRVRLKNWRPPIILPDNLIIVCLLRLLPAKFHSTRTIIMSTKGITLKACKEMLLDVENGDAERIAKSLGSSGDPHKPGTALAAMHGNEDEGRKGKKKKRKGKKSEKYLSEGPCSFHGSRCTHSSSECYTLHPELKPPKKSGTSLVVSKVKQEEAEAVTDLDSMSPFGFMNSQVGYGLMMFTATETKEEIEEAKIDEVPEAIAEETAIETSATLIPKAKKYYAVAVGHEVGIYITDARARKAYEGYSGPVHKSFKKFEDAVNFIEAHKEPRAHHHEHSTTSTASIHNNATHQSERT